MFLLTLLATFPALAATTATPIKRTAEIFPLPELAECLPTQGATHRIEYVTTPTPAGKKTEIQLFKKDGTLKGRQTLEYQKDEAVRWNTERFDYAWKGSVAREGAELALELTVEGEKKHDRIKPDSSTPVLIGPSLSSFVTAHFKEIAAGQTLHFQVVALDRLTTYAFTLTPVPAPASADAKCERSAWQKVRASEWLAAEMRPDSSMMRMFAPSMHYWINAQDGKIQAYYGPNESLKTNPKEMVKGLSWFVP